MSGGAQHRAICHFAVVTERVFGKVLGNYGCHRLGRLNARLFVPVVSLQLLSANLLSIIYSDYTIVYEVF